MAVFSLIACVFVHPHGTTWLPLKLDILVFFKNLFRKFKISLKCIRITILDTKSCLYTVLTLSCWNLRMKNVSDINCRQKQDAHFMFSNFFSENNAIYEEMWKNRPHLTILVWCMHISCYRHTLSVCNTYRFSTARMVMWMCLSVMFILIFPLLFIYGLDEFWPSKGETQTGECSWNVWNTLMSPNTDIITCSVCGRGLSWNRKHFFVKNITCF